MSNFVKHTSYKNSDSEWLGEIPSSWPMVLLSQIVTQVKNRNTALSEKNLLSLSYGRIKRKPIDASGGLLPASFDGYNIIEANDIVLRLTDLQNDHTSLRVALSTERGIITSAYTAIRPRNPRSAKYLYYLLHTFDIRKGFYGMGSGVRQGLNYDEVKRLILPLPAEAEQVAIGTFLDAEIERVNCVIAEAKASIEEYKAWKASIIYEAVTKGLDPDVEMKDSGYGWIGCVPAHWKVSKIGRFVNIRSGITLGKTYPKDTKLIGMPYLRVANVKADGFVLDDVATIQVTDAEAQKYALRNGELLMTEGGDRDKLGRGTIWHEEISPCLHQNHIFAVTCNEKWLLTPFLAYLTASPVGREYFDVTAKKTTNLASTNSNTILQFRVPVPDTDEQQRIVDYLNEKCKMIADLITEKQILLSDLEAYKKSLIFEVVTGKRRVC